MTIFLFVITPNSSVKELSFDNRIKFSLGEAYFPSHINLGGGYIWDSCPFAGWMRRTPPGLPGCLGRLLTHAPSRAWCEPGCTCKYSKRRLYSSLPFTVHSCPLLFLHFFVSTLLFTSLPCIPPSLYKFSKPNPVLLPAAKYSGFLF